MEGVAAMEGLDGAKRLAARAMANGVDEARATRVAADLAPLLAVLAADEQDMLTVEPAIVFRPMPVTRASDSA